MSKIDIEYYMDWDEPKRVKIKKKDRTENTSGLEKPPKKKKVSKKK